MFLVNRFARAYNIRGTQARFFNSYGYNILVIAFFKTLDSQELDLQNIGRLFYDFLVYYACHGDTFYGFRVDLNSSELSVKYNSFSSSSVHVHIVRRQ